MTPLAAPHSKGVGELDQVRLTYPDVPADAVHGAFIRWIDPAGSGNAVTVGAWWVILDPSNPRIGAMHSRIDPGPPSAEIINARAREVERYNATLLLTVAGLDILRLVRQGEVFDHTQKNAEFQRKLDLMRADLHRRGGS